MGFTRYWRETGKNDCCFDDGFLGEVNAVLASSGEVGIALAGGDGNGTPEVASDLIVFNGEEPDDFESLVLSAIPSGFSFCKTGRRPYDPAALAVLMLAEARGYITDLSSDDVGFNVEEAKEILRKAGVDLC